MINIIINKEDFKELYNAACDPWKSIFNEKFKRNVFSDTLESDEELLNKMNEACTAEQKPIFNEIFKEFLSTNLFNVTTYTEVCKQLKELEITEKNFNLSKEINIKKLVAQARVQQLMRFFNGNWKADFNNRNQSRYYPYYKYNGSGWVFGGSGCGGCGSGAWAGIYKNKETSDFVGKTFLKEIYLDIIN